MVGRLAGIPKVDGFLHAETGTITYVVHDPGSGEGAIVDPVLDLDPATGAVRGNGLEMLLALVRALDLKISWILETHVHADHVSAAWWLRERLGARIGIGEHVLAVRGQLASSDLNVRIDPVPPDFDHLFADGEALSIGGIEGRVMHTPGHTPACVTYVLGDAAFIGDTLFMPDVGSARCDFPGGDPHLLYRSVRRILDLPPETRLFVCHDYPPAERLCPAWATSVADQRKRNIHLNDNVSEQVFVRFREQRDRTLPLPRLFRPSLEANIGGSEAAKP